MRHARVATRSSLAQLVRWWRGIVSMDVGIRRLLTLGEQAASGRHVRAGNGDNSGGGGDQRRDIRKGLSEEEAILLKNSPSRKEGETGHQNDYLRIVHANPGALLPKAAALMALEPDLLTISEARLHIGGINLARA